MAVRVFHASHPGLVRSENEDALICRPDLGIYAVADGAGGHRGGRAAAELVVGSIAAIPDTTPPDQRRQAVLQTVSHAHDSLRGSGNAASTLALLMLGDQLVACLWAGDSRIYRWRAGALSQISRDHSLVQELLDAGLLSPAQARVHPNGNIITRAIGGSDARLQLEERTEQVEPGDRYLLCSDGLSKTIDDDGICRLLGAAGDIAQLMLETALKDGARDNVSVIVICHD